MGKGALVLLLEMLKSVFMLQMLSETSVDKAFMHHFEKCRQLLGLHPQTPTGEPFLDLPGGLPSFRPPYCPPVEKILRAPMVVAGMMQLSLHVCKLYVDVVINCVIIRRGQARGDHSSSTFVKNMIIHTYSYSS